MCNGERNTKQPKRKTVENPAAAHLANLPTDYTLKYPICKVDSLEVRIDKKVHLPQHRQDKMDQATTTAALTEQFSLETCITLRSPSLRTGLLQVEMLSAHWLNSFLHHTTISCSSRWTTSNPTSKQLNTPLALVIQNSKAVSKISKMIDAQIHRRENTKISF